ncbi:hypothetical protein PENSPDRAFT_672541 [Peniophora sp. CONT]|nr:hypothetical protein PENSPDRAFT_672541 [Peniophora sp. CONT]
MGTIAACVRTHATCAQGHAVSFTPCVMQLCKGKKHRASAAQAARNENYHEHHGNGMKKRRLAREEATDCVVADNFDDVFRYEDHNFGFSQGHVNKVAAANWECNPALLPVDTFVPAFTLFNPHHRTEPLTVCFVDIVRKRSETKLIGAYHELVMPIKGMKGNRASDRGAWHLGYWETTANQPHITAESKAPLQNIHNLLFHVKNCTDRARAILMHTFKEHPCLDLGDGFHAIAIKNSSSD